MNSWAVIFLVGYGGLTLSCLVLYNLMVNRLRQKRPGVRAIYAAGVNSIVLNTNLFRQEFNGNRQAMRLCYAVRVLGWSWVLLLPVFLAAFLFAQAF